MTIQQGLVMAGVCMRVCACVCMRVTRVRVSVQGGWKSLRSFGS